MRYLGFAPQETVTSTDAITPAVNGAIQEADARIQAAVPAIGARPVARLLDMVNDPKFLEIIQIANQQSGKSTRVVNGMVIDMNPTSSAAQAADSKLATAYLRQLALKLRVMASWLTLSRYAPRTLARATVEWCRKKLNWNPTQVAAALAAIAGNVVSASVQDAQRVYAEAIRVWHDHQPRVAAGPQRGQLITSGPAYQVWMASKPPTPPGLTTLNGGIFGGEHNLQGLSGSRLKRAYRALHGLGDGPDGSNEGQEGVVYPDGGAGNQSGTSGTPPPETKGQEAQVIAALLPLLMTLLAVGIPAATRVAVAVATGAQGQGQGQSRGRYNPDGTSNDGSPQLPAPPSGYEYDANGILIYKAAEPEGIPGWAVLLGIFGIGYAVTRKG